MIFGWFKKRRRAKLLSSPFPAAWNDIIVANVRHDRALTPAQRERLRRLVQVFVPEKNWEGCGGLSLTDEIKITIAAQACLLVVGMEKDLHFDHVPTILVYPTSYVAGKTQITRAGVVVEGGEARLGEAWWNGPVVLSWADAKAGGAMQSPGQNLVLHEFSHQLDMMNGRFIDGTPPLKSRKEYERWAAVCGPEFDRLVNNCNHRGVGFLDCYAATNPAEFFAVLTETFFERPQLLQQHGPALYDVLTNYYRLDPASWSFN